jgi:hypothetical protein
VVEDCFAAGGVAGEALHVAGDLVVGHEDLGGQCRVVAHHQSLPSLPS